MTLTIEIPPADEPRVRAAFGNATDADLVVSIKGYLGQSTLDWERAQYLEEYTSPPLGLMA